MFGAVELCCAILRGVLNIWSTPLISIRLYKILETPLSIAQYISTALPMYSFKANLGYERLRQNGRDHYYIIDPTEIQHDYRISIFYCEYS